MVYSALFEASSEALRALAADPKFVGTDRLGFFGVLHTWGRTLEYHPHVHYVVPGGGLSADGSHWLPSRADFLVPAKALSVVFRAKFRDILRREGLLETVDPAVWSRNWVVHSQAAGDGRESLRYLAPYVFRVAIGDHRIVSCDDGKVTFAYRRVGSNRPRKMTLDATEFLRRFLQHVLPAGFQKVRHYGFLSPNSATSIEAVRWLITLHNGGVFTLLAMLTLPPAGPTAPRCPACGGPMALLGFVPAQDRRSSIRASPMTELSHPPRRSLNPCRRPGRIAVRAGVRIACLGGRNPLSSRRRAADSGPPALPLPSRRAIAARLPSDVLTPRSPLMPRAVTHVRGPAVASPGFLNTDWRSGFADSNPWTNATRPGRLSRRNCAATAPRSARRGRGRGPLAWR